MPATWLDPLLPPPEVRPSLRGMRTVAGHASEDPVDELDVDVEPAQPVRTVRGATSSCADGPTSRIRSALERHPEGLRIGMLVELASVEISLARAALRQMPGIVKAGSRRHRFYKLKSP